MAFACAYLGRQYSSGGFGEFGEICITKILTFLTM